MRSSHTSHICPHTPHTYEVLTHLTHIRTRTSGAGGPAEPLLVGVGLPSPAPCGPRHHGDDKRSEGGRQQDGSDLARPDCGPEWAPVDGCRAVQPRDEPGDEGGDREG